jgi:hypothetical protein
LIDKECHKLSAKHETPCSAHRLALAVLFVIGAVFASYDVLTHENIITNPLLRSASGWLVTGFIFLRIALRGQRRHRKRTTTEVSTETERSE